MSGPVLVGDVGGTSVRFSLATKDASGVDVSDFAKIPGDAFASFDDALASYLDGLETVPDQALFALAGPRAQDGSVKLTNRESWPTIVPGVLESRFGFGHVELVNDFAAMARAVPEMPAGDFVTIRDGSPIADAPIVVTGPGTGFGVSAVLPNGKGQWMTVTGQGGHAAYAPRTVREAEMTERLRAEHGYVSTEMVVSGRWLQPVHDVISDMHGVARCVQSAREILDAAEAGDPVAEETCLIRAKAIMGAAGDLVLINGGLGGVVLTGGVAERMPRWLCHPDALERFTDRGSETNYVAPVPVSVLTSHEAPLIGAAALLFDSLA